MSEKPKIQLILMPECVEHLRKHGKEEIDHPDALIEIVWSARRRSLFERIFGRFFTTPHPHRLHPMRTVAQGPGAYFIVEDKK